MSGITFYQLLCKSNFSKKVKLVITLTQLNSIGILKIKNLGSIISRMKQLKVWYHVI